MKNTPILLALVYLTLSSFSIHSYTEKGNQLNSKSNNSFNEFRVHRNGQDKMACVWSFSNETAINQYVVLKTYNDPSDPYAMWEQVAIVSPNASRSYKIIDSPVYPGFISYKVRAIHTGGSTTESNIITQRIHSRH